MLKSILTFLDSLFDTEVVTTTTSFNEYHFPQRPDLTHKFRVEENTFSPQSEKTE